MSPSEVDPEAKAKVDDLRRRATGLEDTIDAYIEAAERQARERAAAIVAQAEREAEEIRAHTKTVVNEARERVNELMRLRQALFATFRETLGDFEGAIARAEEERNFPEGAAFSPSRQEANAEKAEGSGQEGEGEEQSEGTESVTPTEPVAPTEFVEPAQPHSESAPVEAVNLGPAVRVEVGPLRDYEAVNAIERAFSDLPATRGVHLRSFDDGVAVLETFGVNVNMLLNSMRASFTIPFIVRSANAGQLELQVDEFAPRGEGH
jgi:hypothetical protein